MSSVINKKENSIVEISFDISVEDFKAALQKAFQNNSKKFNIPGFRPGKAPMAIVMKTYGEGVLYDEAIEIVASSSYVEAIKEYKLEPVSRPDIGEITEIGSDKGVKFTILVTVKPEVTLGEYKGIDATKKPVEVTGEQVDAELDKIRERNSRLHPVEDRAVLTGDTANIDYEGFNEGVPFEGGKGTGYDLKIGSNTFIPGFEEQVIGRSVNDEFDVNVSFPEDYHSEDLKGKAVVFKVKVNSVKVQELPAADDEFAKDVSEFDTLEEYKESLRKKLVETEEKKSEMDFEDQIFRKVLDNASVEIPEAMVENEITHMIEEQSQRMSSQGIKFEQYLQYIGQDMDAFKESIKGTAKDRVKTNLVIEAIGIKEEIKATPEEIDEEIKKIAELYKMKEEDIRSQCDGDFSYLENSVVIRKTIELLKSQAKSV